MSIYYIKNSFQDIINSNLYFINHHYLSRYISIITKFKNRDLLKKDHPGFHGHHIVPRCLKGTNEKSNIVVLSPREHFIVHHLLWKAFPKTHLTTAFKLMVHGFKHYHGNNITSRVYEQLCLDYYPINQERNIGKKVSEETRRKISENQKGRKCLEETRKKISESNTGRKQSEETKLKISESHKGKKKSEESIRKTAEGNRGQKRSEELRRKMSEERKGKKQSEEHIRNRSESYRGNKHSEESRRKMSESAKNRPKKIWVCSLTGSKLIQKDLLDEFLSNGFILGRKFN